MRLANLMTLLMLTLWVVVCRLRVYYLLLMMVMARLGMLRCRVPVVRSMRLICPRGINSFRMRTCGVVLGGARVGLTCTAALPRTIVTCDVGTLSLIRLCCAVLDMVMHRCL